MNPAIPESVRMAIRNGEFKQPTPGLAPGYAQANLVILPQDAAYDFLLFAQRNPKPCPLLEVTDVGSTEARRTAPGSDLRTDIPRYRVYRKGELSEEPDHLLNHWQDDFVAFLLGCSFTFESAMIKAGIPVRHIDACCNVSMYKTNIPCDPAGIFRGNMVVSMRPIPSTQVVKAVQVTSRFPSVHGAPVHIGDPKAIGITDLSQPDFGDPVDIETGEVPVFWACGVTPQLVATQSKPPLMITHAPGHMFVTDIMDDSLSVL